MNTLGAFDLFSPSTWFDSETDTSSGSAFTGSGGDLFGFDLNNLFGGSSGTEYQNPGLSDADIQARLDYMNRGGTLPMTPGSTSSGPDLFSGFNDLFSGLFQNLPGLVNLGVGTWTGIEKILQEQSQGSGVNDTLVYLPGYKTPVIKRVQNGSTTYHSVTDLYPGLAPQVTQAQKNSWIGPALIAGVLGVGLILILKKK